MPETQETVTGLLKEMEKDGGKKTFDALFPLVYDELRGLALRQRRQWQGNNTLNTTALVNEAYLKLVDQTQASLENRAHFFATAAKAMRHILINYARDRQAGKRGGGQPKLSLDEVKISQGEDLAITEAGAETLIAFNMALEKLAQIDQRQSQIVDCRFFAGMTIEETATALGTSAATVNRGWALAQVWLYRELKKELD